MQQNRPQNNQPKKKLQKLSNTVLLLLSFWAIPAFAYDPKQTESESTELPQELKDVGITEQNGARLDKLNLNLKDENGQAVTLNTYLTRGRPVILSLVYYSCPSLCNLHLNGVLDALKQLTLVPGKDYELLAVSFDPKEDSTLAAAKKVTYQEKYEFPNNAQGIHFLTGDENSVKTLADAIGFKYKWEDKTKEWAHASAAVLITPEGVVSRYLHGVYFDPKTFRLSIVETSKGMVGTISDSIMLFCFRYDPKGSKYALYSYNLMRAACGLATVLVLIWLIPFWRRQSRKAA